MTASRGRGVLTATPSFTHFSLAPDAAAAAAAGGNYTAAVTDDQPHRPPLLRGWCRLILSGSDSHLLSVDHFMDVELAIRLVRLPADPLIGNSTHTHTHTYIHTRSTALFRDYPGEPVPER